MKRRKDFESEGRVESSAAAFSAQTELGWVVAQDFHGHLAQDGEVVSTLDVTHLAVVFTERHIQHPMTAALHSPIAAHQCGEPLHVGFEAA